MNIHAIPLPGVHEQWFDEAGFVPYHRMYGKQYCLPVLIEYEQQLQEQLASASESIDRIFWKVMRFTQRYLTDEVLLHQLGLPPSLLNVVRMETPLHGIARQDWIIHDGAMKMIEYNTDTPTGVPETAWLAGRVIDTAKARTSIDAQVSNPSAMMEQRIISMFCEWLNWCEAQGFAGPIWFTSYGEHIEDRANMTYLVQLLQTAGIEAQYIALADLQIVPGEALYAIHQENSEMRQVIEILVRLYPLEYVASERDASGFPIGEALLELVESEKLAMMNPTQSMLSQSKGMLALIWSLFERNEWLVDRANLKKPLFNKQECADIERWLLPTYWSDEPFRRQNQRFVSKAFFGREGKGTLIHGEDQAHDSQSDELQYYQAQPKIYQQFQAMHELTINTEHGPYQGYLLTGVYVIGRKYAGILPRVGEQITGDLAYFCPASVRKYSK